MKKLYRILFWLFITGIAATTLTSLGLYHYFSSDLPNYTQLQDYDPPVVTRLYAKSGDLFHEFASEKRFFLPVSHIPQHIVNTFLAAEDSHFYQHHGVDFLGIFRAFITNIRKYAEGKRPTGASTITQQVAKNFLLTNQLSWTRKIKEALLAFRLESAFSKDKLLELYLNEIYLGAGTYGVAAASLHYFSKPLSELTIEEAAFLAALPKAPNSYHPSRHPIRAVNRRNWVIQRMEENGLISSADASKAIEAPLTLNEHRPQRDIVKADFFSEEVRRQLIEAYGAKILYEGGLTVKTTLDPLLQLYARDALRTGLKTYDKRFGWRGASGHMDVEAWHKNPSELPEIKGCDPWQVAVVLSLDASKASVGFKDGSQGHILFEQMKWARPHIQRPNSHPTVGPAPSSPLSILKKGDVILVGKKSHALTLEQIPEVGGAIIVLDPDTGHVLAMEGGYSYDRSEYNRATQAYRQPGSAFKAFVYLTALEKGIEPNHVVLDQAISIDIGWGLGSWEPINIMEKFYGPVTVRTSFENSYNISTVQIARAIGIKEVIDTALRLKVYTKTPIQWAMALGAGETTLLKLTTAFGMIANGGKEITPTFIDRIQDRRGKTIFRATQGKTRSHTPTDFYLLDGRAFVSDPASTYQMTSLMEGVILRGTGKRAQVDNYPLAGKSGTSNDYKDVWFVGFSPHLVVGVFIGFDTPKSLGKMETGGKVAAPIFQDFMTQALKTRKPVPFKRPPGLKFKKLSLATGKTPTLGEKRIITEGLKTLAVTDPPPIGSPEYDDYKAQMLKPAFKTQAGIFDSVSSMLGLSSSNEKISPLLTNSLPSSSMENPDLIPPSEPSSKDMLPSPSLCVETTPILKPVTQTTQGLGGLF